MEKILNTKLWLIILATIHTFMGVIAGYFTMGGSIETLAMFLYMGVVTVYLLYAAFMTEGQSQARFATVLCAPMVIWFLIGAIMKLEMLGHPVAELPRGLLPIFLWTMPTICGIRNWNPKL